MCGSLNRECRNTMNKDLKFVFFGTPNIAVYVLEELEKAGYRPSLVVTAPDKPRGRKLQLTPPEVKVWAEERSIPVLQPEKIDETFLKELERQAPQTGWDTFIVAAYGSLLPKKLLDMPAHSVVNVHPSLLPRLRGPNPIRGAIIEDEKEVGVSIMLLDEKIDHGPLLAQEKIDLKSLPEFEKDGWPPHGRVLDECLARAGGVLLAHILPGWISGNITPQEQDHDSATFTHKVTKEDGLLDLNDDPYKNLLKIRAYEGWPGTHFFKDEKRVKIVDAEMRDGKLRILRVIPEGKKEINYSDFLAQK